jgi:hypothetical protein
MHKTIAALLLAASGIAAASEEGLLALGAFRVESPGIGESGPVTVSGRQSQTAVESLEVKAFGKVFTLTKEQLKQLRGGGMLNNVQLTYETGYKELGGRTVYVRLGQGFTSGSIDARIVAVSEDGKVTILPERKP